MATVAQPIAGARARLEGIAYHWQALAVIVLGSFMVVLNMTMLNVALPRIIQIFETTVDQGQLAVTAYMLAIAVVMPATSYAADTFGPKRAYLTSIGLFTLGTALCGLAPSIGGLIGFRILQGLGGAMIMPLGMSILFQVAPARQRGTVMGVYGLPLLVAPMIGPVVGGYLVEHVGWRLIFGLGIPVGALAVLLGAAILREAPARPGARFDWAGFVLAAVGLSAALLALSKAPTDGWTAPHVLTLWLLAAAAIPSWIVVELAQERPLLDLDVLRDARYRTALLASFCIMIVFFSSFLLLPLFLQGVRGLGPLETGLLLAPEGLAAALTMPIAGRLLDKLGPRLVIIPGIVALAAATWLLASLDPSTPDSILRMVLVLRGIAMGSTFMPLTTAALDTIAAAQIGRATVLANVLRQLAGAFGTAVFASLYLERQQFHQAVLAQTVAPSSIATVQALSVTRLAALEQGLDQVAAEALGLATLARRVAQMASVRAFDDCFFAATFVALLALLPMAWLKRVRRV